MTALKALAGLAETEMLTAGSGRREPICRACLSSPETEPPSSAKAADIQAAPRERLLLGAGGRQAELPRPCCFGCTAGGGLGAPDAAERCVPLSHSTASSGPGFLVVEVQGTAKVLRLLAATPTHAVVCSGLAEGATVTQSDAKVRRMPSFPGSRGKADREARTTPTACQALAARRQPLRAESKGLERVRAGRLPQEVGHKLRLEGGGGLLLIPSMTFLGRLSPLPRLYQLKQHKWIILQFWSSDVPQVPGAESKVLEGCVPL